tara:strand:+ start:594 stop:743 length:150 start_codon:yes stop_codon:yes gene_type:complete
MSVEIYQFDTNIIGIASKTVVANPVSNRWVQATDSDLVNEQTKDQSFWK